MTPYQRSRLQARSERIADENMRKHGGDWGYRLVPFTLLPKEPRLVRVPLPTAVWTDDKTANPKRRRTI